MTAKLNIDIKQLFNSGSHYGFTKRRRHPSVIPYIYATKDGNDVIDLSITSEQLHKATSVIQETVKAGKQIMFVGTKDEVSYMVRDTAKRIEVPYATNRWIGGMLTNFSEVKKRIKRLQELQQEKEDGTWERKYTKKERVMFGRELAKLDFNFGGIKDLVKVPDLLIVFDPRHESIAIDEALMLSVPVIAVAGTDCDVNKIEYPIVMNDALQGSVRLALAQFATAHQTALVTENQRVAK